MRIVQINKLANDTTAVNHKAFCFSFNSLSGFGGKNGAFKFLNTDLIADKGKVVLNVIKEISHKGMYSENKLCGGY